MELHNLTPAAGSVRGNKRKGRGQGSGRGGTSTRGHKGAKSRSGYKAKRHHEGGRCHCKCVFLKKGLRIQIAKPSPFQNQRAVILGKAFSKPELITHVSMLKIKRL